MSSNAEQQLTSTDPLLVYPNFTCRFPYHNHESRDEIFANARSFLLQHWPFRSEKEKNAYIAINVEDWGTMLVYGAPKERAEIYTIWETFFVLLDDILEKLPADDAQVTGMHLIRVLSLDYTVTVAEMNDIELLLHRIGCRIRGVQTDDIEGFEELTEKFIEKTCQHILWVITRDKREDSLNHGLEKYLEYRIIDIGGWCSVVGQLWSRGIVIPPHLINDQDMHSLQEISLYHGILINDLYSYRKEKRHFLESGGSFTIYNSVVIFRDFYHMSPSDTIEGMKAHISSYEDTFLDILARLRARHAGSVKDLKVVEEVAAAMMDLMKGNAHWSAYTPRYNS